MMEFQLILENKVKVLERLIQDGLSENTKHRQLLAIHRYITELADELTEQLRINHFGNKDEADFLTGPQLKPGESRFHS